MVKEALERMLRRRPPRRTWTNVDQLRDQVVTRAVTLLARERYGDEHPESAGAGWDVELAQDELDEAVDAYWASRHPAVLQLDHELTEEEAEQLKASWLARYGSVANQA